MQEQYLTLMASAGSGKTFALTLRYLSLLFYGANASEILTLTFTKKAAGEMRERIIGALKELAYHQKSDYLEGLINEYKLDQEMIYAKAPRIFENFLMSNTKIMTLDSFFNFIVRRFCWNVGLSKNFTIKQQDQEEINEFFLSSLDLREYQKLLNFCIKYDKNTQIFDLLHQSISRDIVFDIEECQSKNQDEELQKLQQEILDVANKIKRKIEMQKNITSRVKNIIKTQNIKQLIENPKWLIDGDQYFYFKKFNLGMQDIFDLLKEKIQVYFHIREKNIFNQLNFFREKYQNARHYLNLKECSLSFSDVMLRAHTILVKNFEKDFFYFRLDDRISHILLDEFQDTNKMQYDILEPLILEIASGFGRLGERSLFFVGDKKQSIYGFRGSDSTIFDRVRDYESKRLPYNYRSESYIVDFNNQIFSTVFKDHHQESFKKKQGQEGGYIKVYPQVKQVSEIQNYVVESLKALFAKGVNANTIAILCYKNNELDDLKSFLSEQFKTIDFITESNLKLTQRKQPIILMEALLFAKNKEQLHYKNIIKLLGLDFDKEIKIPNFEDFSSLSSYLFACMQEFKICDLFAQKFLEISFEYEEVDIFLKEIEKIDIDLVEEKIDGIRLMTIHSSKGLEFDHVIICDRFGNPNHRHESFFVLKDRVFYYDHNKEDFDRDYAIALQEYKKQKQQEANNVLYVAFTRAKKSLFIIPKEKGAFQNLELEVQEIGVIEVTQKQQKEIKKEEILPVLQQDFGRQENFVAKEPQASYLQKNRVFGEAIHYVMESTFGFGLQEEIIKIKLLNHYGFYLNDYQLKEIWNRFYALKSYSLFSQLLSSTKYFAEVVFVKDTKIYRIDALLIGKEIVVLDYKSGNFTEKHYSQIKNYIHFAKQYFNQDVKGYLVYLQDKIVLEKVE